MMNIGLPLGIIAYGVYMVTTGGVVGHDTTFWVKVATSLVGGLYLLISNNLDKIKSYSSLPKVKQNSLIKQSSPAVLTQATLPSIGMGLYTASVENLLPTELETKDDECVVHLRNRLLLANSKEGLETLAILDGILFKLTRLNDEKVN